MSQIEAVFFDCDGTLVDSEVICSRAYVTMFREFGIHVELEEIFTRFKGVKLYEIIDIISKEQGVTMIQADAEHVYRAEELVCLIPNLRSSQERTNCWRALTCRCALSLMAR